MSVSENDTGLSAAKRLQIALGGVAPAGMVDVSRAAGVERRVGARARRGKRVNAQAYLAICAVRGIDAVTGFPTEVRPVGELRLRELAMCVTIERHLRSMSRRAAAQAMGLHHRSLGRLEIALPVSIDTIIAACRFMSRQPDQFFTCNSNCATSQGDA